MVATSLVIKDNFFLIKTDANLLWIELSDIPETNIRNKALESSCPVTTNATILELLGYSIIELETSMRLQKPLEFKGTLTVGTEWSFSNPWSSNCRILYLDQAFYQQRNIFYFRQDLFALWKWSHHAPYQLPVIVEQFPVAAFLSYVFVDYKDRASKMGQALHHLGISKSWGVVESLFCIADFH